MTPLQTVPGEAYLQIPSSILFGKDKGLLRVYVAIQAQALDGDSISPFEIAKDLKMKPIKVVALIERLLKDGWVKPSEHGWQFPKGGAPFVA